ncbi:MAG TPA: MarR family winged helix-turn-helix transcriptional regulator [Rhizobacter sp.]|nr:MarR family winged helix-turn-helix transcriptional regulator [Rhizobacter sp.]
MTARTRTGPSTAAAPAADAGPRGCTHFKLKQLSRSVSRRFDATVGASGLKTTQFSLLNHVALLGPIQPSALAARMSLDASTLTRNLQPLIAQGWLELGAGADARSRLVTITEAGRVKWAEAKRLWKQAQIGINDHLGPERVARLHALLDECMALMADDEGDSDE